MLKQRVVTALALLIVLLVTLWAPAHWPFQVLMAVAIALATWEWARLCGYTGQLAVVFAGSMMAFCAAMYMADWPVSHSLGIAQGLGLVGLSWVIGSTWMLRQGVAVWQAMPAGVRMFWGMASLGAAWLATVQLHGRFGVWFLLSVLALVWVADICAYFAGRALGKRKLAPTISPGKSWAGVYGGLLGTCVFSLICAYLIPISNYYSSLVAHQHVLLMIAVVLGLTAMSVVGDLVESLMKRSMGMKDSSQLLPGHGGVLDRIDGLIPVLPMAVAVMLWLE